MDFYASARPRKIQEIIPIPREENELGLTEEEQKCMSSLGDCHNQFLKLERQHPDELRDFVDGIHKIQGILAMRVVRRVYPEGWPIKKLKER